VAISFTTLASGTFEILTPPRLTLVTSSVSPAANKLILLCVNGSSVTSGEGADPDSAAGAGLTFSKVASVSIDPLYSFLTVWRAMSASPSTGAVTITWSTAQDSYCWSIIEVDGINTSGTNGSGAIVQAVSQTAGAVSTNSVTLAAFADATNNAGFAVHAHEDYTSTVKTATVDSGWTELLDFGIVDSSVYTEAQQIQYRIGEDTSAGVTWSAVGSDIGSIAIEIAAAKLSQPRFRWRNDDGTETTATWAAAENTNITSPLG